MSFPFTETPDDYERYPMDVLMLLNLNIGHPETGLHIGTISVAHAPETAPCYVQVAICGNWLTDSDGASIDPGFWGLTGEDAEEVADLAVQTKHADSGAADRSKPDAGVVSLLRKIGDVLGENLSDADSVLAVLEGIDSGEIPINLPDDDARDMERLRRAP